MMMAPSPLEELVAFMERQGADGIELGPTLPLSIDSFRGAWGSIKRGPRFLLHNYFPHPAEAFVLNLASADSDILEKSRAHCRQAVELCAEIGSPFYSVHAGFSFHAHPGDLGKDLSHLRRWSLEHAGGIFVESLHALCSYGQEKGIRILIENNVLASFNLTNGRNELLLGVTSRELIDIVAAAGMPRPGLLIDVGHLNVSARTLGFSKESFLEEVGPYVDALHLSDNDGVKDDNQAFTEDAWFMNRIRAFPSAALIIEVCGAGEAQIGRMIASLA